MKILAVVIALLAALPAQAKTLTVGVGQDYTDIQDALDAASSGDVVNVLPELYELPGGVNIRTDNVTLKGAGADQTFLDGGQKAYAVVRVNAKSVTIEGFTIQRGKDHGIYVSGSNSAEISYNVITKNGDRGILLGDGKPWAVIDHNSFVRNKVSAVYTYRDEPRTRFTNNIFFENGRSLVTDRDSGKMTVRYNCFYGHTNDDEWVPKHKTNIEADPEFEDPDQKWRLLPGSPCLGAGEDGTDIGALGKGDYPTVEKALSRPTKGKYRVVVFAKDQQLAEKVVAVLKAAGYAGDESHTSESPNDNANIKYGAATKDDVDTMRKLTQALYGHNLEELDEFGSDDYDVFINLP